VSSKIGAAYWRLALLAVAGFVVSISEPATVLDTAIAHSILGWMPSTNTAKVCKITVSANASWSALARQIDYVRLKNVRGIIVMGTPADTGGAPIRSALYAPNLIWVAEPSKAAASLDAEAICRPLLVSSQLGSVLIAAGGRNPIRSAAALALTCSHDVSTFSRLGDRTFKVHFTKGTYPPPTNWTNTVLVCITCAGSKESHGYNTPAGRRTDVDYLLDICQALLDQRYLTEPSKYTSLGITALVALAFTLVRGWLSASILLLGLSSLMFIVCVAGKVNLPMAGIVLNYLLAVTAWPSVKSNVKRGFHCLVGANSERAAPLLACLFAGVPLVAAVGWEPIFRHNHEQGLQILGLTLICMWMWIYVVRPKAERAFFAQFMLVTYLMLVCAMALFPSLLDSGPKYVSTYRGIPRWNGWTIDPNNSAVALALALVIALHLKAVAPSHFYCLLNLAIGLCSIQLARSFSRIGILTALLGVSMWLLPKWRASATALKERISVGVLLLALIFPLAQSALYVPEVLIIRRLLSFTNVMDLSWANRLYVLPGTIQAALDRPITGWGWGNVLPVHQMVYCPTFIPDNTAVLLNDYAHLAASYGIPVLIATLLAILWSVSKGDNRCAKTVVLCLSVAMFFQGVVRIPLTFIPLCMTVGMLLGEAPPWKRSHVSTRLFPWIVLGCLGAFLFAWCALPLLSTSIGVRYGANQVVICGGRKPLTSLCFVTDSDLWEYGREARAAASLGVRAVICHGDTVPHVESTYGSNTWVSTSARGERHIPATRSSTSISLVRGVKAVCRAYDSGAPEAVPCPDKPFTIRFVILTLYACVLVLLLRECCLCVRHPKGVALLGAFAAVLSVSISGLSPASSEQNAQVARWAVQMSDNKVPDGIYREFVLNPTIAPGFSLDNRREVWHTFYQSTYSRDPMVLLERLRMAIETQVLIRPDQSPHIRPFGAIWRTRTCNLNERWYMLVSALRVLNVPARMNEGSPEMWVDGRWLALDKRQ
jgi:hypothetical protein